MAKEEDRTRESLVAEVVRLRARIACLEETAAMGRPASARLEGTDRLQEFARFAVENLSDGTYLISRDATIVYANDAGCRMLGYSRDEIIGMSMMVVNPHLTRQIWDSVWAVTSRDSKQAIESEHRTKDGRLVPVEVLANHVEIDGQEYSCAFTRDITHRLEMERRIRHSEKMEAIGQLAGGIAHDFNNQLAGIVGSADVLKRELVGRPELERLADAVLVAAKRSADLTQKLLAFARQGKFLSTPIDLHEIVDEVVHILERSVDKRIRIRTALDADPSFTLGDPSQLQNAVLNMAINAGDAMPEGGELTFSTRTVDLDSAWCAKSSHSIAPGRYVRVAVADTGIGMDAATQARIFEPFFTTKEPGKGTGMGLAAVYGTVTSHGGAIEVRSQPGQGTEMALYVPAAAPSVAVPLEGADGPAPSAMQVRVLLVEDEMVVREVTTEMLRRLGCEVVAATNGKDAIALCETMGDAIDVAVLDVAMPELSGKDTFTRLCAINPKLLTILVSGYSIEGQVQSILDEGAAAFLQKPFSLADLAKTLSDVLRGARPAGSDP